MPIEQEFQALLAKAAADIGDDSCTVRFRALAEEMADLKRNEKTLRLTVPAARQFFRIKQALEIMKNSASTITAWEDSTIRQLVGWVKILSAEEILVCLHGGLEIRHRSDAYLL